MTNINCISCARLLFQCRYVGTTVEALVIDVGPVPQLQLLDLCVWNSSWPMDNVLPRVVLKVCLGELNLQR